MVARGEFRICVRVKRSKARICKVEEIGANGIKIGILVNCDSYVEIESSDLEKVEDNVDFNMREMNLRFMDEYVDYGIVDGLFRLDLENDTLICSTKTYDSRYGKSVSVYSVNG